VLTYFIAKPSYITVMFYLGISSFLLVPLSAICFLIPKCSEHDVLIEMALF